MPTISDPNSRDLASAVIARSTLSAHRREVNKEISARDRKLGKAIESIARRDMGQELPLSPESVALAPEVAKLLADPTHGL